MVAQTGFLFHVQFPLAVYAFVLSGAVCSYNFHWYLTPPETSTPSKKLQWNFSNKSLHFFLFLTSLAGAALSALFLIEQWFWLGVTAFLTFLYSAPKIEHPLFLFLRRIAIGKTIFLAVAWTHVTVLLPLLIAGEEFEQQHFWFIVNRFFFIYSICIVFDRRDVESDRAAGIKSLVTYFSPTGVDRLFWMSVVVAVLSSILLLHSLPVTLVVVLIIPALLMGLLYNYCKRNSSDYLYYFLLDGLMALSAAILILANFAR